MKTGRPARLVWTREESTISEPKRHPSIVKMRTGASRDGVLLANDVEIIYDTGAYAGLGPAVLDVAIENCNGPYKIPNIDIKAWLVYTNNHFASAFRGVWSTTGDIRDGAADGPACRKARARPNRVPAPQRSPER
jgi:CO/xanthine dehydrogenase Mo-binding subunit